MLEHCRNTPSRSKALPFQGVCAPPSKTLTLKPSDPCCPWSLLLVAKLSGFLQAIKGRRYSGIKRRTVCATHRVQECILGDTPPVRSSMDGQTSQTGRRRHHPHQRWIPCRTEPSWVAVHSGEGQTEAHSPLPPEREFIARVDNRCSVQAQSVLPSCGGQHILTSRGRGGLVESPAHRKLGVPEVGDDPHAQRIIAEGGKRSGVVSPRPVRTKSPILSEVRSFNACHREAGRETVAHGAAGRGSNHTVDNLLQPRISLSPANRIPEAPWTLLNT
jgi:hypothetical protein